MFQQRFQPDYDTATQNFERTANRRLRTLPQETVAQLTTSAGDVALPIDYLTWRCVLWTGTDPREELDYTHPAYLTSTYHRKLFTIEGNTFKVRPADDTRPYEFHYYKKIPTIIGPDDNASNWLIQDHGDLYLEGILFELFVLGRNGEAAIAHKQLRDEKFGEVIRSYALTTGATSPQVRSAEYF
jgi:hypothetical protein